MDGLRRKEASITPSFTKRSLETILSSATASGHRKVPYGRHNRVCGGILHENLRMKFTEVGVDQTRHVGE
jgi:hypothetical protein